MNFSEKEILNGLRKKNKKYFEFIFKKYYGSLCFFAEKFVEDPEVAEDLVQDFFIRFWNQKNSFYIKESLNAYLYRSVKNICLNHIKHQKVKEKHQKHIEALLKGDDPEEEQDKTDMYNKIYMAIEQLPPQCKKIFTSCVIDGLKYQETADKLGISINTVKTQMGKAYRLLKEKINIS